MRGRCGAGAWPHQGPQLLRQVQLPGVVAGAKLVGNRLRAREPGTATRLAAGSKCKAAALTACRSRCHMHRRPAPSCSRAAPGSRCSPNPAQPAHLKLLQRGGRHLPARLLLRIGGHLVGRQPRLLLPPLPIAVRVDGRCLALLQRQLRCCSLQEGQLLRRRHLQKRQLLRCGCRLQEGKLLGGCLLQQHLLHHGLHLCRLQLYLPRCLAALLLRLLRLRCACCRARRGRRSGWPRRSCLLLQRILCGRLRLGCWLRSRLRRSIPRLPRSRWRRLLLYLRLIPGLHLCRNGCRRLAVEAEACREGQAGEAQPLRCEGAGCGGAGQGAGPQACHTRRAAATPYSQKCLHAPGSPQQAHPWSGWSGRCSSGRPGGPPPRAGA